jgi:Protein of unknown function (DUF2726)
MEAILYLLLLAPFVAIPILWWHYRGRMAAKDSMSDARWQEIVVSSTADPAVVPVAAVAAPLLPRAGFARRERLLDPAQTVLYYVLKNGLPDHEVMPRVGLAQVLDVPAEVADSEREQRLRSLAQHTVDFVVCNKALQVVAVIDLPVQEPALMTPAQDFKSRIFSQAGIRYLRLSRKALPKRDAVRVLVLGG